MTGWHKVKCAVRVPSVVRRDASNVAVDASIRQERKSNSKILSLL